METVPSKAKVPDVRDPLQSVISARACLSCLWLINYFVTRNSTYNFLDVCLGISYEDSPPDHFCAEKHGSLHVNFPLLMPDFKQNGMCRLIFENFPLPVLMKFRSAYKRMDRHVKANGQIFATCIWKEPIIKNIYIHFFVHSYCAHVSNPYLITWAYS